MASPTLSSAPEHRRGPTALSEYDGESSSDDGRGAPPLEDELLLLLSSRRPCGWPTRSALLCQQNAMRIAGLPQSSASDAGRPDQAENSGSLSAPSDTARSAHQGPAQRKGSSGATFAPATQVPIAPLELDFISGPRMGEKLVLCERVCTLGRGEGNTIQVNDSQLASVSRVHCIFEYVGNRWHMRDNSSTNGTWRRLSCVLEPSDPIPLQDGVSIQAGVHEFLVEEVEMPYWWLPSVAFASFEEICEQESERGEGVSLVTPPLDQGVH